MLPRQPCSPSGAWWSGALDGHSTNKEPYLVPHARTPAGNTAVQAGVARHDSGVRQPGCRSSRAHDPARGIPFPILVTEVLNVLVPIIESIRHVCDTCA
ncbi:MAG: hypothetical protein KatS3mg056_2307 [Chloroflexus sp.]|nr:MAG: hypothetical protein KatS3mg056_2307 [Chloroflexus sp.]